MRGQEANLKMDLYPYQEYGVLKGVVSNISLSSVDKGYLIYFDLPKGLTSSAGYDFAFAETMYGQAEIITKDKRLISRILIKYTSCLIHPNLGLKQFRRWMYKMKNRKSQ